MPQGLKQRSKKKAKSGMPKSLISKTVKKKSIYVRYCCCWHRYRRLQGGTAFVYPLIHLELVLFSFLPLKLAWLHISVFAFP